MIIPLADERHASFLYLTNDEKKSNLLLIGDFSKDKIIGYKSFFNNVYVVNVESKFVNNTIIRLEHKEALNKSFDNVILSGNLRTVRENLTILESLMINNPDIGIVIKFKGKPLGIRAYQEFTNLKKKFDLVEYIALPTIDSFKIMLDCSTSYSCSNSLKLYNPVTVKQIVRNYLILFLIKTKLLRFMGSSFFFISRKAINNNFFVKFLSKNYSGKFENIALHNASAGSGAKAIIAPISKESGIIGFLKVSNNEIRKKLIINEFDRLNRLKDINFTSAVVPTVKYKIQNNGFTAIYFEKSNYKLNPSKFKLSAQHIAFLSELFNNTKRKVNIADSDLISNDEKIIKENFNNQPEFQSLLLNSLEIITKRLNKDIFMGMAHRDFVPWNIKVTGERKLFVYDWEWAGYSMPFYDLFHFIIHGNMHIKQFDLSIIIKKIITGKLYYNFFKEYSILTDLGLNLLREYLLFYLIDRMVFESSLGNLAFDILSLKKAISIIQ